MTVVGDDIAVRVTAPRRTRDELVAVLDRVEVPADRTRAPAVLDPPFDLAVVGSLDADAVLALSSYVEPRSERLPGPTSAHVAAWIGDEEQGSLSVMTLPGRVGDLAALPAIAAFQQHDDTTVRPITINGEPGAVVERPGGFAGVTRAIWLQTDWGDTVVVTAVGRAVPGLDELQAVAKSVRRSEEAEWEAFVIEATGGPGLHPDPGSVEIARGSAGGVDWLLQTGLPTDEHIAGEPVVDPCLKLSNRRRACTIGGTGGIAESAAYSQDLDDGMPPFALVTTSAAASQVRVTTTTDQVTAPLTPVPGMPLRAAVVVVNDPGAAVCITPDDIAELGEPPFPTMRVEIIDAAGNVTGCIGMGAGR